MSQESKQPRNDADLASAFSAEEPALRRLLWGLLREASAVDDVLQTTFLKFLEHRPQRLAGDPALAKDTGSPAGSLRNWLFRVATNEALLVKRKRNTQARHLAGWAWLHGGNSPDFPTSADSASDPHRAAMATEQQLLVRQLLLKLPEEQQTILRLRIYENLKFAEIAAHLNLPLGTVLTRMRSALQSLKTGLEKLT